MLNEKEKGKREGSMTEFCFSTVFAYNIITIFVSQFHAHLLELEWKHNALTAKQKVFSNVDSDKDTFS